jgi:hypothetical protein
MIAYVAAFFQTTLRYVFLYLIASGINSKKVSMNERSPAGISKNIRISFNKQYAALSLAMYLSKTSASIILK